ncbi:unnamed protein product [Periconia digitata]|uniref:Uncharacterized protein n=1 Tax=Periconia digitata TaxID=1303443 RepID=A0A9W4U358_9PLEO|nr:unnamed protein product [Periconia digitata]
MLRNRTCTIYVRLCLKRAVGKTLPCHPTHGTKILPDFRNLSDVYIHIYIYLLYKYNHCAAYTQTNKKALKHFLPTFSRSFD